MANNKQNPQFNLNSTPRAITLSLEEVEPMSGIFKRKARDVEDWGTSTEIVDPEGNAKPIKEVLKDYPNYEVYVDAQGNPISFKSLNKQIPSIETKGTGYDRQTANINNISFLDTNVDSNGRMTYYNQYGTPIAKTGIIGEIPMEPSNDLFYMVAPALGLEDYVVGKGTQFLTKQIGSGFRKSIALLNKGRQKISLLNNKIATNTSFDIPGTNLSYGFVRKPNTYNRVVNGQIAIDDAIQSGLIRSKTGIYNPHLDATWNRFKKVLKQNGIKNKDEVVKKYSEDPDMLDDIIDEAIDKLPKSEQLKVRATESLRSSTNHGGTVGFMKQDLFYPLGSNSRVIQGFDNSAIFKQGHHGNTVPIYNKDIKNGTSVVLESNGSIRNATADANNFVYYEPITPKFGPINSIYKRVAFKDKINEYIKKNLNKNNNK